MYSNGSPSVVNISLQDYDLEYSNRVVHPKLYKYVFVTCVELVVKINILQLWEL